MDSIYYPFSMDELINKFIIPLNKQINGWMNNMDK